MTETGREVSGVCDRLRSAGFEELPNGMYFRATHRDGRLTIEMSVPCEMLRSLALDGACAIPADIDVTATPVTGGTAKPPVTG